MIASIVFGLALAYQPAAGAAFSDADMCTALTGLATRVNAASPQQLDATTRIDGVDMSCDARSVIFNKASLLPETRMRTGWREGMQADLNRMVCSDPRFRQVILRGWRFGHVFTLQDGVRVEQIAHCEP